MGGTDQNNPHEWDLSMTVPMTGLVDVNKVERTSKNIKEWAGVSIELKENNNRRKFPDPTGVKKKRTSVQNRVHFVEERRDGRKTGSATSFLI